MNAIPVKKDIELHLRITVGVLMFFLSVSSLFSQNNITGGTKADSLKHAFNNAQHDTLRIKILDALMEDEDDVTVWPLYNAQMKLLVDKNLALLRQDDPKRKFYLRYLSTVTSNTGYLLEQKGDIAGALEQYQKCLTVDEEMGNLEGEAAALNNIGVIYHQQADHTNALVYFKRCLALQRKMANKKGEANSLGNIGVLYQDMKNFSESLKFHMQALEIQEKTGDNYGMALSLNNIGLIKKNFEEYASAFQFFKKSLVLFEQEGDRQEVAYVMNNCAEVLFLQGKMADAVSLARNSLERAQQLGFPSRIRNAAQLLAKIYKRQGKSSDALRMYELYITMRDSIANEATKKAAVKNQLRYEIGKKAAADSVAHAKEKQVARVQMEKQNMEIEKKRSQQYFLFGGLALVLVFSAFIYHRFRVTQYQKKIIEGQKRLVEEKQKEILDSIYYARRIQRALITNEKYIGRNLTRLNSPH